MKYFENIDTLIKYIVFGALTTLVNITCYYIFYTLMGYSNPISVIFSWFFAVSFACFSNKYFVFKSKTTTIKKFLLEIISFFSCRLLTGGIDLGIMVLFVDIFGFNAYLMKILSNLIVIILNFMGSKLIFKNTEEKDGKIIRNNTSI